MRTKNLKKNLTDYRPRGWGKVVLRFVLFLLLFLAVAYVSLAWYVNSHREEVLANVTQSLNEDLNGTLRIGKMETTFLQGFPRVSLRLENVVLRDSLYHLHRQTLLTAKEVEVSVNTLALMRGAVVIKKIDIHDAAINLFTDGQGYSNTSVFKKKQKGSEGGSGSFPELRKLSLDNVTFNADNRHMNKLYRFKVDDLDGNINYNFDGWEADVKLDVLAESMAFSTLKGSFIRNKRVEGKLEATYDEDEGIVILEPNRLNIGGENFRIGGRFEVAEGSSGFTINIENRSILWRDAARLLSPNITRKLEMFDIKKPIAVKCDLIGDFNVKGDPLIQVSAEVRNNELDTPGGIVTDCSFKGVFTNNFKKDKGYTDANSAIQLFDFKGTYADIPFTMSKAYILDLEKPVAVGDFRSNFKMEALGNIIDDDLLKFKGGTADVALGYRADIVDFKLSKPLVNGIISIKDASIDYVPRRLNFNNISVNLDFTKDDLRISRINLKSGKSIVNMEGSIKNFLNLYYTAPETIVLNWEVYSPQLHLGEFMGFVGSRQRGTAVKKGNTKGNFTEELNDLFEKSNVDMKLRVDKVYYNKFYATDARADVLLTDKGFEVKNAGLKHAGGALSISGNMAQTGKVNKYRLNATVANVDISRFFSAFSNFGLESLRAQNLKGFLSSKANITGSITDAGVMVPKSMYGTVNFALKKGALLNFEPVKNVGKFAFPFRDMDNITFSGLSGRFDVKGEKVTIYPMKINSSVLNMDIEGVYSFGRGTNIYVDVPLRNPKKDEGITDEAELARRRNRGIVLHLVAADDKDGKVKVKLGKKA